MIKLAMKRVQPHHKLCYSLLVYGVTLIPHTYPSKQL